ncbi:sigma factor-like helix-turn-helix DNA-binding protein [Macrococcus animalis]|uniref:sigma factor-like helix-turn-helix DNA-binding protein n=1 Tax=Macrococcus animalis TaxID=3395467 RepID=UPI0039BE85FF
MIYDRDTIDKCIRNIHKVKQEPVEDIAVTDFFNMNLDVTMDLEDNHTDELILFNEIEDEVLNKCTDREAGVVYMLSKGMTYKQAGKIFGLSHERIRQIYNKVLDKVSNNV